jgi:hypothetical protein
MPIYYLLRNCSMQLSIIIFSYTVSMATVYAMPFPEKPLPLFLVAIVVP